MNETMTDDAERTHETVIPVIHNFRKVQKNPKKKSISRKGTTFVRPVVNTADVRTKLNLKARPEFCGELRSFFQPSPQPPHLTVPR